jgi:hypothetical protein
VPIDPRHLEQNDPATAGAARIADLERRLGLLEAAALSTARHNPATGVHGLRTLGTGALEAAAGNHTHTATVQTLSLVNNWSHYDNGAWRATVARYGTVCVVNGLVHRNGGIFEAYNTISTLPAGFRPATNGKFAVESLGNGVYGVCQIEVLPDGTLRIGDRGGPANPVEWVALGGIAFTTE